MAGEISREMENSLASVTVFPGFKFSPTDTELISYYLKLKMEGSERSVEIIPEVEIYNFEPWDLPDKSIVNSNNEWFFFCARGRKYPHGSQNKRATEKGYWKATGKERNVKSGSEVIGTKRTLVFHIGRAPKGERTEWIMHEYCMKGVPLDAMVVYRLRRNTEFQASTSQNPPEPNSSAENLYVMPNDSNSDNICEWENMVDYYLSTESGQELINDIAKSAQNLQTPIDEDFFADILKDEIVKLDDAVIQGNVANEIPRMQTEATTSRVLPLPNMLDKQMKMVVQQESSIDKPNQKNEPLSRCLIGIFSVKRVNRNRWFRCVAVLVVMVMLVLYFA